MPTQNLEELLGGENFEDLHQMIFEFYTSTKSTTQKAEATRFKNMSEDMRETYAQSLYELLYGERTYPIRFDSLVAALEIEGGRARYR